VLSKQDLLLNKNPDVTIVKMKYQLLLIFASTFIAALASPLEDITNHLAKRQSVVR
jgi:hypothetical protein